MGKDIDNRDVSFTKISDDMLLAVACDSCGAIGEKEGDVVKVPPYIVGRFSARVALMEVLAVGAEPRALTAAICSEPDPTGEGILVGIRDELKSADLQLPLTISTEKNMPTTQTGLGITVVGTVRTQDLRVNSTSVGDRLYSIGIPKVGGEVFLQDPDIADSRLIRRLLSVPSIHDIIPVGSKGIRREAQMLIQHLGLSLQWASDLPVDIEKTAGPATCVLVTSPVKPEIQGIPPIHLLGEIV